MLLLAPVAVFANTDQPPNVEDVTKSAYVTHEVVDGERVYTIEYTVTFTALEGLYRWLMSDELDSRLSFVESSLRVNNTQVRRLTDAEWELINTALEASTFELTFEMLANWLIELNVLTLTVEEFATWSYAEILVWALEVATSEQIVIIESILQEAGIYAEAYVIQFFLTYYYELWENYVLQTNIAWLIGYANYYNINLDYLLEQHGWTETFVYEAIRYLEYVLDITLTIHGREITIEWILENLPESSMYEIHYILQNYYRIFIHDIINAITVEFEHFIITYADLLFILESVYEYFGMTLEQLLVFLEINLPAYWFDGSILFVVGDVTGEIEIIFEVTVTECGELPIVNYAVVNGVRSENVYVTIPCYENGNDNDNDNEIVHPTPEIPAIPQPPTHVPVRPAIPRPPANVVTPELPDVTYEYVIYEYEEVVIVVEAEAPAPPVIEVYVPVPPVVETEVPVPPASVDTVVPPLATDYVVARRVNPQTNSSNQSFAVVVMVFAGLAASAFGLAMVAKKKYSK